VRTACKVPGQPSCSTWAPGPVPWPSKSPGPATPYLSVIIGSMTQSRPGVKRRAWTSQGGRGSPSFTLGALGPGPRPSWSRWTAGRTCQSWSGPAKKRIVGGFSGAQRGPWCRTPRTGLVWFTRGLPARDLRAVLLDPVGSRFTPPPSQPRRSRARPGCPRTGSTSRLTVFPGPGPPRAGSY